MKNEIYNVYGRTYKRINKTQARNIVEHGGYVLVTMRNTPLNSRYDKSVWYHYQKGASDIWNDFNLWVPAFEMAYPYPRYGKYAKFFVEV